ncbi:hypothetical protein HA402_004006 [Bradysia odoriphaga]|nr:hypothetical protein HA402_004006 [Bradysia odoriphaga]
MKNPHNIINVIGTVVAISLLSGDVLSARPPIIKQFEVDEFNNVIKPFEQVDGKRSEIVVEKVNNLRLECHSDYPVQWIYSGNGIPIINTDISRASTLSTTDRRNNGRNGYIASIFLGSLKEQHTGKYQCSRTDYVTVVPNLYIYVPGQDLFTSTQGKTIQINPNVTSTTVPCTVSDPRIKVSLFKLDGNVLKRPVTKADDAITYDPRKGFRINLRKIEDPEGRYLCTAYYNNDVRDVEYTIASSVRSDDVQSDAPAAANYEEFKKPTEETCTGDACKQCQTHTDCPPNMNCYTDFKCRDPCEYSIRCGTAAMCRIVENRPKCYCPSGFVGDATKECLNISRERYERYERYP